MCLAVFGRQGHDVAEFSELLLAADPVNLVMLPGGDILSLLSGRELSNTASLGVQVEVWKSAGVSRD